jgi:hypothetical protein
MPRLERNPGEMALPTVGVIRGAYRSFGAGWNPQGAGYGAVGFAPPKPPRKRPGCKTCKNDVCVGHCKF